MAYSFVSHSFCFHNIAQIDVHQAVLSIKSDAVGVDGINAKFIKLLLPHLLILIEHIFNHCLTTSTFPSVSGHYQS